MQTSTIITINKDGIVQSVDKNCCKMFGYELDELVGHPVKLIIPPPYKEQHDSYMQNYLNSKIPKVIGKSRVVEGQSKDGAIFPIRLSVSKIGLDAESTVFIGMIDKLEDKSGSVTINTSGIIVSCNQNVEDIFGYKVNELIGQNVSIVMPSNHKDKHDSYLTSYLNGSPAKVIGKVRNVPAKHKSGTLFPISLQVEQLKVGAIQLFRGKVEKVDVMEAVFTLDEDGKVIACNQNFVQALFGYTNPEIVGQNISKLIPSIHQSSNSEEFDNNNNTEEPKAKKAKTDEKPYSWKTSGTHHKEVLHRDGSFFAVILEINPFQDVMTVKGPNGENISTPVTKYSVRMKRAALDKEGATGESQASKLIGKYYVIKTVGQGSYGKVKLAIHKETKLNVAIKILQKNKMKQPELERTRRETDILRKLSHPHIACLLEIIETEDFMNIVMEFAGRTLLSYVLEKSGLGEIEARKFFMQLLSAVKYCHDRNIIHRDIKHQNILLDDAMSCKLIDFGLSNFIEDGKLRSTFCGTPAYAAPEMILGKRYIGPEVDIWSMGVVLYSMITGVFPFENVGDIIKGSFKDPTNCSKECCELLKKMLQVDVNERATLEQVIKHVWVKDEYEKLMSTPEMQLCINASSPVLLAPTTPPKTPNNTFKEIECKVVDANNNTN